MKVEIEIDEVKIKEMVEKLVSESLADKIIEGRYGMDGNFYRRTIQEQTRAIIYKDKEKIIDRVVAQSVSGMKSKILGKMIERMSE